MFRFFGSEQLQKRLWRLRFAGNLQPNLRFQPTAYTRRGQRPLVGVSPFVEWRAWPVTGGG
jgi:hypothetical protein